MDQEVAGARLRTFRSKWTTHGISYAVGVHQGFLLWGSAPSSSSEPLTIKRVVPHNVDVVSHVRAGKETVVTAVVSGKKVTVVIPDVVVSALELAWKRVNDSV